MQKRRSYQWLSRMVDEDTERVVGFQKMFGVQWVDDVSIGSTSSSSTLSLSTSGDSSTSNINALASSTVSDVEQPVDSLSNSYDSLRSSLPSECSPRYLRGHILFYILFRFGAFLGEELFYTLFLPNFGWTVNWRLGRWLITLWTLMYYSGQLLKDILQLPRPPSPPVVHLEHHFSEEYGLPSTHAMAAISLPFFIAYHLSPSYHVLRVSVEEVMGEGASLLSLLSSPLQTPPLVAFVLVLWMLAFSWWSLMTVSRLYLGVHSFVDVISGMILGVGSIVCWMVFGEALDRWIATSAYGGIAVMTVSIAMVVFFYYASQPTKWTPCFGDTTLIVGVGAGALIGNRWVSDASMTFYLDEIPPDTLLPTLFETHAWFGSRTPLEWLGVFVIRSLIGYVFLLLVRTIVKHSTLFVFKLFIARSKPESERTLADASLTSASFASFLSIENVRTPADSQVSRYATEIPTKYITYFTVSFFATVFIPAFFEYYGWW